MTIFKYFDQPKFNDAAFYHDRPVSDHIHESGHRERLLRCLADVAFLFDIDKQSRSMTDLGCGNGGLMWEFSKRFPDSPTWGYELSPLAVQYGKDHYRVDITHIDFVNALDDQLRFGDVIVMSEVLEHLIDPVAMLKRLRGRSRWIVASCPSQEDDKQHYEFHLWAWDMGSFLRMFEKLGYQVILHYSTPLISSQFLVAKNP